MGIDALTQLFFSGITIGSIYALVALGFLIIYNATGIVNFAQGEFVMLGGMMAVTGYEALHLPLPLALALAVLVVTAFGALFELAFIHPLKNPTVLGMIMITVAGSILIRGIAMFLWGKEEHGIPAFSGTAPVHFLGASIAPQALWIIGIMGLVLGALYLVFQHTMTGKAMRAVAANRDAASLVGIPVRRIVLLSFAVSAGIGAIAGVILTPMTLMSFDRGTPFALKGFSAAVVGGLGNPAGAVLAGLGIGLVESFGTGLISSHYKDVFALVILLGVLFLKPEGLFSRTVKRD